jgi:GNAT superfamily N-acetyltransferase
MAAYSRLLQDASASDIQPVLDLSNAIFSTEGAVSTHHGSLKEWQSRLAERNSIVVYASTRKKDDFLATGPPIGFIFAHPRHGSSTEEAHSIHIWLAGISPASRGGGIFQGLMNELDAHARERNISKLSVCTYPAKFGTMYRILLKTGWRQVEELDGGKVLLRKNLVSS